jgi:hypothetical protein
MNLRTLILLLPVVAMVSPVAAQTESSEKTFGDPSLKEAILEETREFYGKETAKTFLLTNDNVLEVDGANSTELERSLVTGAFVRIVAFISTGRGKYGVEYYLRNGRLVFVYETFEYFAKNAPAGAWQNFRHIAAWERRSYFRARVVAYSAAIGKGAPEPGGDGKRLQEQARHAVELLANRPRVPVTPRQ